MQSHLAETEWLNLREGATGGRGPSGRMLVSVRYILTWITDPGENQGIRRGVGHEQERELPLDLLLSLSERRVQCEKIS